jgi:hypothetical protein
MSGKRQACWAGHLNSQATMACVTVEIYDMRDVLVVPKESNGCLVVHVECINFFNAVFE